MDENMIMYVVGAFVLIMFITLMITFFVSSGTSEDSEDSEDSEESKSWFNLFYQNTDSNGGTIIKGS